MLLFILTANLNPNVYLYYFLETSKNRLTIKNVKLLNIIYFSLVLLDYIFSQNYEVTHARLFMTDLGDLPENSKIMYLLIRIPQNNM